jgi:hypothetical protein
MCGRWLYRPLLSYPQTTAVNSGHLICPDEYRSAVLTVGQVFSPAHLVDQLRLQDLKADCAIFLIVGNRAEHFPGFSVFSDVLIYP